MSGRLHKLDIRVQIDCSTLQNGPQNVTVIMDTSAGDAQG